MKPISPVRQARKNLRLRLVEVAEACDISVSSLSNIERCLLRTRADVAARIVAFYAKHHIFLTEEHVLFPERFMARRAPQASRSRRMTPPKKRPAA